MRFVKSNLAKKIIIILITIMIFNIAIPKTVNAGLVEELVDLGAGLLFKPIFSLFLSFFLSVDVVLGLVLNGVGFGLNGIDAVIDLIKGNTAGALENANNVLQKIFIGPDTIFMGNVGLLNANIFSTYGGEWEETAKSITKLISNSAVDVLSPGAGMISSIRNAVAQIYVSLRNICALVMLAGLIFTGIRILLSSNIPTKKTQYLMLLQDWLLGMVILIFSHIIMIGIFYVSDTLTGALSAELIGFGGINFELITSLSLSLSFSKQIVMTIMLGYTIWLTIVFAVAYFKRLMWVSVLTVFAPVFSVMYAFGQQTKQIYSRWLREYIMTVFIQPFHIVIYAVLVGVPLTMVTTKGWDVGTDLFTMIYALVAISFIRPAEKWMRGMFGFDKGIANMASYDSGKQTFDAAKNAIDSLAKKIAMAAAAVYTGGAAAGLIGSAGGAGAAAGAASGAGGALGEAGLDSDMFNKGKEIYDKWGTELDEGNITEDEYGAMLYYDQNKNNFGPNVDGNALAAGTDQDDFSEGDIKALTDGIKQEQENNGNILSASNITIQTSNLEIQGLNNSGNQSNNGPIETIAEGTENAAPNAEIASAINDGDFELGEGEGKEKNKKGFFDNLGTFTGLMSGSKDISSVLDSLPAGLKGKIGEENIDKIKAFDSVGGFSEAYKGFNSVMDTMYVDGGAPQDWKNTANRMDENKKKRDEKAVYNFSNNKENKEYISMKLMEEAKGKYSDPDRQQQYVDNNLENRLKSLAQTYAPMGVTSAKAAYELKEEGKKLGLSPEEAFLNRGNFERFNANQQNTAVVNATYKIDSPTVSQAIPNAREYYNNGYRNIQHMMDAQHIKDTLRTTTDMAMKLENVLRNTGKVNYNGADKAVQAKIDEINKYYEKRLKGGK